MTAVEWLVLAIYLTLTGLNGWLFVRYPRVEHHVLVATPEQWDEMCEQVAEVAQLEQLYRRSP